MTFFSSYKQGMFSFRANNSIIPEHFASDCALTTYRPKKTQKKILKVKQKCRFAFKIGIFCHVCVSFGTFCRFASERGMGARRRDTIRA